MPALPPSDEFFLDPRAVRRSFDAASTTYDAAAAVQSEIRARLLERLDIARLQPAVVLDLGAGTGHAARALKQRYPGSIVIALDLSEGMLQQAARQQRLFRRFQRLAGDAQRLPLQDSSIDLVFSNLLLEWCADPDAVFSEIRRILRPHGLFTFTTLGPDTLKELRAAWRRIDAHVHVHRFIDMHDLGDALMRARFAEPVMDVERLTVTYGGMRRLMTELKASGSSNVALGRRRGLINRGQLQALEQHGDSSMREGVLPVSVEVIYGQAWGGEPRPSRPAGNFLFPIEGLRGSRRR
jgi:malonyl-CoA O-methyltransferase